MLLSGVRRARHTVSRRARHTVRSCEDAIVVSRRCLICIVSRFVLHFDIRDGRNRPRDRPIARPTSYVSLLFNRCASARERTRGGCFLEINLRLDDVVQEEIIRVEHGIQSVAVVRTNVVLHQIFEQIRVKGWIRPSVRGGSRDGARELL